MTAQVIDGKLNKNIPVTNTLTLKNAQGETVTELAAVKYMLKPHI